MRILLKVEDETGQEWAMMCETDGTLVAHSPELRSADLLPRADSHGPIRIKGFTIILD